MNEGKGGAGQQRWIKKVLNVNNINFAEINKEGVVRGLFTNEGFFLIVPKRICSRRANPAIQPKPKPKPKEIFKMSRVI